MTAANKDFFEALSMLEHERGITAEYLIEKIKAAIIIAVKKNYEVEEDHIRVDIDPDTGRFDVALIQDIVADEDWYDEHAEIGVTEARKIRSSYEVGDRIITPLKTRDFGRIAAQTAKHVIRQGIREAERNQQLSEIQSRAHDIVQATVTRVDTEKGIVALDLGKGGEAVLPRNEQVPGEVYTEGETLQVYIVDVVSTERGPRVMISRTHPGLVKRLFELEVPEIFDGTVEVKAISREAGARTKMAVWSKDANVNPVSACIGPHGDRVAGGGGGAGRVVDGDAGQVQAARAFNGERHVARAVGCDGYSSAGGDVRTVELERRTVQLALHGDCSAALGLCDRNVQDGSSVHLSIAAAACRGSTRVELGALRPSVDGDALVVVGRPCTAGRSMPVSVKSQFVSLAATVGVPGNSGSGCCSARAMPLR